MISSLSFFPSLLLYMIKAIMCFIVPYIRALFKSNHTIVSNISNDNATETIQKNNVNYDEYTCSTCGAKLITDETTTITDCLYCGSRQILKAKIVS